MYKEEFEAVRKYIFIYLKRSPNAEIERQNLLCMFGKIKLVEFLNNNQVSKYNAFLTYLIKDQFNKLKPLLQVSKGNDF